MARVPVAGNTYPVKDQLKALGATWDKEARVWMIDPAKLAEAKAVVATAPPPARRCAETRRCWECGCTFTEADARRNGGDWREKYCGC